MTALDVMVGAGYLLAGLSLRRTRTLALLAAATGVLWFAGDLFGPLVFAHRAPATHLLLLYPASRLPSRRRRWAVGAAYATSFLAPIGREGVVTVTLCVAVLVAALSGLPAARSAERRSTDLADGGAVLTWGALTVAVLTRATGIHVDSYLLTAYDGCLLLAAAVVVGDDLYRRSRTAIVTNLAIDLGASGTRSLRDVVAQALGDPSVIIGLRTPGGFIDEGGQPVVLNATAGQVVTDLLEGGRPIAALQHDPSLLRDRSLLGSVTALAAVALSNIQLQHDVELSIAEVAASRGRLLAVADAERARLETELRTGVLRRLSQVATLLEQLGSLELCRQLDATRDTIREFARGVYPRALDEVGLSAIRDLEPVVATSEISVPGGRYPRAIEAAVYFLCVEALTNVAKYAHASRVKIVIAVERGVLTVEVADDGRGGADSANGSGLIGLRDRLDVLGGVLTVSSSSQGTRVRGSIPLPAPGTAREPSRQ